MGKPPSKGKKKAAAAAKKKEMEELALKEQAAVQDEYEFQKACLEIRVKELENLNLGLQRKSEYLESQNEVYKTQLEDLKEEKEDLVGHLQRCYTGEKTNVKELEDRLYGTHQAMLKERKAYEDKLRNKDETFDETQESLNKKIMDLEAKMTALEDFRIQKENLTYEKNNLKKTLEEERDRFVQNYDELENNLIRYRERIKNESVEMVKKMASDVQKAGKLCLTATVKSAIANNVRLQNELEETSKDNLTLRGKLKELGSQFRDKRMTLEVMNEQNSTLRKKCLQYRLMTQELLDKHILLQQQLDRTVEIENELISVKAEHSLCQTEEDIREQIAKELDKVIGSTSGKGKRRVSGEEEISEEDPKDVEIFKLQDAIIKMAIASKCLSQVSSPEESDFVKEKFKLMLTKIFYIACDFPNLSPEIKQVLQSSAPQVTPFVAFNMGK